MADDQKIEIGIELDSNAAKELKDAIKAFDKFSDKVKKSFDESGGAAKKSSKETSDALNKTTKSVKDSTRAFDTFKGVLAGTLAADLFRNLANQALALGRAFVQTFIVDGVRAAAEQEAALKNLAQQMRSTGDFSDAALSDFQAFAQGMQQVSTVGDETSLKMLALAKTFGVTNDRAKDLVTAAIELSAAKGMSLESAVVNLGKSLAGLTGELGEAVAEVRTLTVEELKAGRAIDLIGARFSGSALAATKTYAGQVSQLSNAFGDFQETTGSLVTQNTAVIALVGAAKDALKEFEAVVNENADAIGTGLKEAIIVSIEAFQGIITAAQIAGRVFDVVVGVVKDLAGVFASLFISVSNVIEGRFSEAVDVIKSIGDEGSATVKAVKSGFTEPLDNEFTGLIEKIKGTVREASTARQAAGLGGGEQVNKPISPTGATETELQEGFEKRAAMLMEENDVLAKIETDRAKERIEINNIALKEIEKEDLASQKTRDKVAARFAEIEKQREQEKASVIRGSLNSVAQLQTSKVKELAALGKTAAIAQATINTYEGATKALATLGPFGFPVAAAIVAAGIANVAKIAGVPGLKDGITEVPGVGNQDNFPAILAPRERVVDANTNQDLKMFLSSSNEMVPLLSSINSKLDRLNQRTIVNIGNKEVADVVRDEIASGRAVI